jgi:hypothetical protein
MAIVRQQEYLTIPGEGIDLGNLHQGVARHLGKLRQVRLPLKVVHWML